MAQHVSIKVCNDKARTQQACGGHSCCAQCDGIHNSARAATGGHKQTDPVNNLLFLLHYPSTEAAAQYMLTFIIIKHSRIHCATACGASKSRRASAD